MKIEKKIGTFYFFNLFFVTWNKLKILKTFFFKAVFCRMCNFEFCYLLFELMLKAKKFGNNFFLKSILYFLKIENFVACCLSCYTVTGTKKFGHNFFLKSILYFLQIENFVASCLSCYTVTGTKKFGYNFFQRCILYHKTFWKLLHLVWAVTLLQESEKIWTQLFSQMYFVSHKFLNFFASCLSCYAVTRKWKNFDTTFF